MKEQFILESFIGKALQMLKPEDYLSPNIPVAENEQILGEMTEFEKGLFTLSKQVSNSITEKLRLRNQEKLASTEDDQTYRDVALTESYYEIMMKSIESRFSRSSDDTVFEIRNGFLIVEFTSESVDYESDLGKASFKMCIDNPGSEHAHFYDREKNFTSDPFHSKSNARDWLMYQIANRFIEEPDQERLFLEIESLSLPQGRPSVQA
jgi:hypothetical protein